VGTAQEEWAQKRSALEDALQELEDGARVATATYANEIEDILDNQRVDVLVRTLTNEMLIGKHNDAIEVLGRTFEEEVPEGIEERLDPLVAAVASLKELCARHQEALQQRAEEVRGRVDKASESLSRMSPGVEAAQQIG